MTAPDRIWAWLHVESKRNDLIKGGWNDEPDRGLSEYLSRSHSNALVAAAYEDAAKICESELPNADWIADGLRCSIPDDAQSTLDAIKARVRREARRVKPLAWERLKGIQTDFKAKCILGTYLVECFDDGDGDYYVWALEWGKIEGPKMESAEAAKAAAQADYERRILSTLMDTEGEG